MVIYYQIRMNKTTAFSPKIIRNLLRYLNIFHNARHAHAGEGEGEARGIPEARPEECAGGWPEECAGEGRRDGAVMKGIRRG